MKDMRKLEVFGFAWEPPSIFWTESTHEALLLVYIPHVQRPENAIYTITSKPPAGSQEPGDISVAFVKFLRNKSHLELDLGLSNVSLTAASVGNLLCLCDLIPHSLCSVSSASRLIYTEIVPRR